MHQCTALPSFLLTRKKKKRTRKELSWVYANFRLLKFTVQGETDRDREGETERARQRERETERETESERDRQTDRDTKRVAGY